MLLSLHLQASLGSTAWERTKRSASPSHIYSELSAGSRSHIIWSWNQHLTLTSRWKPADLWSVQFSSVTESCLTRWDPMDCSMPGLPVHHQLLEFTQTHIHWVGDAIQPSHPLLSPSPPTFNLSQQQGLFKWVSSSHQVAKVLEFQHQHQSCQRIFRMDFLGWTGWISLQSKGLSRVFSNTTVQKHQFFSAQLSVQSNSHIHTWLLEKP